MSDGEPASQKALRQSGSNSFRLVHTRGGSLLASPQKLCKNVLNGPCYLFAFLFQYFCLVQKGLKSQRIMEENQKTVKFFMSTLQKDLGPKSEIDGNCLVPLLQPLSIYSIWPCNASAMHLKTNQGWYQTTNQLGQPVTTQSPHN